MPAKVFGRDVDYQRWLGDNPNGFVLNTTQPHSPGYMILHRASCPHISVASHESEPGGFTERQYIKIGAADSESLRVWAAAHGRPDGTFSNECSHCGPAG